jgi:hypothetical protein
MEEFPLPDGIRFLEVNGQWIFPNFDISGALIAAYYVCLLRTEEFLIGTTGKMKTKWYGAGIRVSLDDDVEKVKTRIAEALTRFEEFNPDGGQFPQVPAGSLNVQTR